MTMGSQCSGCHSNCRITNGRRRNSSRGKVIMIFSPVYEITFRFRKVAANAPKAEQMAPLQKVIDK
jgi:hypothetical protein